jgi:tetratricopeptide (TPR) repeat protein
VKPWQRNLVLAAALLVSGAVRMPIESGLATDLRAARLTPLPMEIGTREKIGQTSSAVALGGLRTLVATFLNLRAFSFFQEKRWDDVAASYDLIVDLAPRTKYYWDSAFSHAAYNAASYYLYDSELPPLRKKQAWRESIYRGREFLERGIRNNPDEWSLYASLGYLLSDSNKFMAFRDPDRTFAEASAAYSKAAATGNALPYVARMAFYSLSRVTGKESEALALGRQLYAERHNHAPTLLVLLFVLEAHENPARDPGPRLVELFGSSEKAYETLCNFWLRTNERFPIYGVAPALESLEKSLKIPASASVLNKPMRRPPEDEDSLTN